MFIIVRASDIYKQMSTYLARRIEQTANIEILVDTSVERMGGNGSLSQIDVVNARTGERRTIPIVALFSFIGAVPRTEWLPKEIETDARGFVRTGPAVEHLSRRHLAPRAVPARDEPPRRLRRRRRPRKLSEARRLRRRRGLDGDTVRA